MSKKTTGIITLIIFVACVTGMFVMSFADFTMVSDEVADGMAKDCVGRALLCVALAAAALWLGYGRMFSGRDVRPAHAYLWCLPCLLVCLANFPFSALMSGSAVIERGDLAWLFVLQCVLIALSEEILFRGVLFELLEELFKGRSFLYPFLIESAVFALCHLFNLLGGASVGATLLQVGYTFLTGAMFTAAYMRTGNLWASVILHAVFDVGGRLVTSLGSGRFQDGVFWVLTAVFAVLCTLHVVAYLYRTLMAEVKAGSEGKDAGGTPDGEDGPSDGGNPEEDGKTGEENPE